MENNILNSENESTIERCPHDSENPYTQVLNDLIRDDNISPNCRLLLIGLLSNKNGWKINVSQLVKQYSNHWGRDKVYSLINEAIDAGYMKKEQKKQGKYWQSIKYFLSERPKFKNKIPNPENQETKKIKKCLQLPENQDPDFEDPQNTELKKEQELKKEHIKETTANPLPLSSSSNQKADPFGVAVLYKEKYLLLNPLNIPQLDKDEIAEKYDLQTIKDAIAFTLHPETKHTKGLVQCLKWACKTKPEIPKTEIDAVEENKKIAAKYDNLKNETSFVEVLTKEVQIVFPTAQKEPFVLQYTAKDFKKKFFEGLQRYKLAPAT